MTIQATISKHINLSGAGNKLIGLCPFHQEKTPSFTVDTAKQTYHCFGCAEGGSEKDFLRRIEQMKRGA